MRTLILILSLTSWVNHLALSQSATEVSGLIIPRDNEGMYVRHEEGQFEVTWTSKTKAALVVGTRLLGGLKGDHLTYKIHSSEEVVTFTVPKGSITGIKTLRGGKQLERTLKEAREEKWLSEWGLKLYFNQKPGKEQLGTNRSKHRMVSASVTMADIIQVIFQSIFKVPKKTAFCEVRNDLPGPPKSRLFSIS